jgi:hypothetical protein
MSCRLRLSRRQTGKIVLQVVRYSDKSFPQRRPLNGKWVEHEGNHARGFKPLDGVAACVRWLDLPPEFNGKQIKDIGDLRAACQRRRIFDALLKGVNGEVEPPPPEEPPSDEDDPRDYKERGKKSDKANGKRMEPLSFRRLKEFFAMEFDDADFVLRNGYLTKGEMLAIFGAGGIGKTRIVNHLIRDLKTGKPFLGRWQTNGRDLR